MDSLRALPYTVCFPDPHSKCTPFRSPRDLFGAVCLCARKAEIKTFDLRIGVVSHTLLSTKIRRGKVRSAQSIKGLHERRQGPDMF